MTQPIVDASGRAIAPAQAELPERPPGPWDANQGAQPSPIIRAWICSYCPNARERTAAAQAAGLETTHGICPSCKAKALQGKRP
jgi:hypothetical protein